MNVKEVMLDSLLATIEEEEHPCVESHIVDEIICSIKSIRQGIELSKLSLRGGK
ncbi:MAG: hypothetical protein ACI8WB_001511 [Phenylobacterium sp.]|jgi:hypothetical protein